MTGKEIVRILSANGWVVDRIRGSHFIMVKDGRRSIPVPIHGNVDLGPWAKKILREAGIQE
jgi:predicted RNA binding protein YcfA (HicA-like mRNA interferase family)